MKDEWEKCPLCPADIYHPLRPTGTYRPLRPADTSPKYDKSVSDLGEEDRGVLDLEEGGLIATFGGCWVLRGVL